MIHLKSIIIIILALIIISCSQKEKTIANQLQIADSYIKTQPQKSLQILDSINNKGLGKDPYFALLYAQAKYRCYITAENDSLIKVAIEHYSTSDNTDMKARTYLVAAQIYKELGMQDVSLNYIHKASECVSNVSDAWISYYIYYLWGRLLREGYDVKSSIDPFELSLLYANELNDTSLVITSLKELCHSYLANNDTITGIQKLNHALNLALKTNSYQDLASLYGLKSVTYYMLGSYNEALRFIDKALVYNHLLNGSDTISNLNFKGRLLILTNHLDSAEYYIARGCDTSTLMRANPYYTCMGMLREAQGDYKGALEYSKRHSANLLKIAAGIERDKVARLDKQYNTARIERENSELKIKQQQSWLYILAIIIVVGIAAFTAYTIYSRRRKQLLDTLRHQSEDINRLQQSATILMDEKIKASEREMALAAQANDKDQELSTSRALIADLKKRLLLNNRVVKKVQETIDAAKRPKANKQPEPLSGTEISELVAAVNDCYNGFANALTAQYPSLTGSEIYLCCLIKIGLDNPGLCAVLGISDSALRKRKYRLKSSKFDPVRQFETLDEAIHAIPPFLPHRDNSEA